MCFSSFGSFTLTPLNQRAVNLKPLISQLLYKPVAKLFSLFTAPDLTVKTWQSSSAFRSFWFQANSCWASGCKQHDVTFKIHKLPCSCQEVWDLATVLMLDWSDIMDFWIRSIDSPAEVEQEMLWPQFSSHFNLFVLVQSERGEPRSMPRFGADLRSEISQGLWPETRITVETQTVQVMQNENALKIKNLVKTISGCSHRRRQQPDKRCPGSRRRRRGGSCLLRS